MSGWTTLQLTSKDLQIREVFFKHFYHFVSLNFLFGHFLDNVFLSLPFRINPNLKSTVYCSAIAAGGEAEWDFLWSMYENATIASEARKIMHALACTKQPWLLNRSDSYFRNSFAFLIILNGTWSWSANWNVSLFLVILFLIKTFVCSRYLQYSLDPEKIRKQDATSVIIKIANNPVGQYMAWDFIRANWEYVFIEWVFLYNACIIYAVFVACNKLVKVRC